MGIVGKFIREFQLRLNVTFRLLWYALWLFSSNIGSLYQRYNTSQIFLRARAVIFVFFGPVIENFAAVEQPILLATLAKTPVDCFFATNFLKNVRRLRKKADRVGWGIRLRLLLGKDFELT